MSHYHMIPIEAKQFFSLILVVSMIKLRRLGYTGGGGSREIKSLILKAISSASNRGKILKIKAID